MNFPDLTPFSNPKFVAGSAQVLFRGDYINVAGLSSDVTPDGEHFLVLQPEETSRPAELHVILNWFEELRQKVPIGKK